MSHLHRINRPSAPRKNEGTLQYYYRNLELRVITERDDIEIPRGVWFAKSYLYISDEKIDAVEVAARLVAHSLER